MNKYTQFDNDSKKKITTFGKLLRSQREDQQCHVNRMPQPYTLSSPYSKIIDFNQQTKIVCQKTDLSLFLDQCNIVCIGDCETGKTSLINRFISSTFDHAYKATRDADYKSSYFEILNVGYNVGIWDLAGEDNYKVINKPYYKNVNVIVAVFDLTKPTTLINASKWMKEALSANSKTDPIRFLVGTKSDLLPKKALEGLESHACFIAQEIDAEYFSTSSRDDKEVSNLFRRIVSLAFDNSVQRLIKPVDYHVVKNNIKTLSTDSSHIHNNNRNEYQLQTVSNQFHHRQSIVSPNVHLNTNSISFYNREPPPPYQKIITQRRNHPAANVRSRVEEYRRRRLSVSDSESDDQQSRPRHRIPPPRVKNEILLDEDLFCPDLVRNCKSLPVIDDDQDYIEIDELTSNLSLHNEVGLPNAKESINVNHSTTMGQNVSLKRPKISLTWVLREQQTQQDPIKSFNWNVKAAAAAEKTIFRKTSKSSEKLFSEKYVSDNNLNDFRGVTKKPNDDKKKDEKIKRFQENCCKQRGSSSPDSNYDRLTDCAKIKSLSQVNIATKNNNNNNSGNYTEQSSIYVTSAQSDSGVNRRYRRYRRKRLPKFGYNINNVNEFLSKCSLKNPANIPVVLSNASILYQTRTGRQVETSLPLGMVVNSIFKNQNWLYVQTPHGEEGYVNFHACLPLGIIQRPQSLTANCWETNTDIFPNPCGNYTDSEKELNIHKSSAKSEGRQTPKSKRRNPSRTCSEKYLDSLYLLASQPKIIDHAYAELKPTAQVSRHNQEKMINVNTSSKRKILLAITDDFTSDFTSVKKGDVVRLVACKEYEDKLWYFIKNRDGTECYIPSSVATEFL